MKEAFFIGSSYKDLLAMPEEVIDTFGYAIDLAQAGGKHPDAKPFKGYASDGVYEVVEDEAGDTFRALYAVKIGDLVYVLHCFQKKSPRKSETPKPDIETLDARLKAAKEHAKSITPVSQPQGKKPRRSDR